MLFPKEFIRLQFIFADKVAQIKEMDFQTALFEYTSMPIRVGVPFSDLHEDNENWRTFLSDVKSKNDLGKAYSIHCARMKDAPSMRKQYGCFSFDYLEDEKQIKLHFANNDKSDPDVLSDENQPKRIEELKKGLVKIREDFDSTLSSILYKYYHFCG